MEWLNYHHLLYFWMVVREGSIARASVQLRLAQPTISGQLRVLENQFGEKLFQKSGRNLVPTDVGRVVYRYADEIFGLGRELLDTVKGRPTGHPLRLLVGVADVLPKLMVYRLLEPALRMPEQVRIVCQEGKPDHLLAQLAIHELDLVLSDAPISPTVKVKAFNHLLGECGISVFAVPKLAARVRSRFPKSLDGFPFLLPGESTSLRRSLDQWFDANKIRPAGMGDFEDSALMKVFGQAGVGAFVAPAAIEREVQRQYGVKVVGRIAEVKEQFFAISVERKLKNPAVLAISQTARREIFQ